MEYCGLIEGLVWALRLDLESLTVYGDSQLVIKQLNGDFSIRNHRLKKLHKKVVDLLKSAKVMKCIFQHIPRAENQIADRLAKVAIEKKENATTCNWPHINELMAVPDTP